MSVSLGLIADLESDGVLRKVYEWTIYDIFCTRMYGRGIAFVGGKHRFKSNSTHVPVSRYAVLNSVLLFTPKLGELPSRKPSDWDCGGWMC